MTFDEKIRVTESARTVTSTLGRWASRLRFEDIPREVTDHAKLCLLDGIGCGLYGARQPWGVMVSDLAATLSGGGLSLLFGRPETASASDAALANGTAIHGFEIDDIHVSSSYHPGAVTIPAVLGVAQARSLSGRDLLVALIAGYEIGIRVGICAGLRHSTSGFHVTGTVGPIGAASAAARLLALDPLRSAHAVALGATQASGLYSARKGAMAKRFHAGRAAQSGVTAALLAERGFTGSLEALEAPFGGFMSTLNGEADALTILDRLGDHWETARVGFKVYAACGSAHTTIDALDKMMAEGLNADTLESLTIRMSRKGFTNVGWSYSPGEIVSAQMNGYFTAAVKLLDGDAFVDQYRPERMSDPRILSLIDRIRIVHDPDLDAGGAAKRHAIIAEVRLKNDQLLSARIEQRLGSIERPISAERLRAKFEQLSLNWLGGDAVAEILERIETIELQADLSLLSRLLAAPRH